MDMKEWIIIGGGALIGLIVLHGLFMAWWRGRDPLRMKIQPGLLPDDADDDDWLSAELPNGGARVVVDSSDAHAEDGAHADDGIPVLLETAGPQSADGAGMASDPDLATEAAQSAGPAGSPLPDLAPIVPERRLRPVREDPPTPSTQIEVDQAADFQDVDHAGLEAGEPSLEEAAFVDSEFEAMPEAAAQMPESVTSFDDPDRGTEAEADSRGEDGADDLLVIHLLAPRGESFSGDALVGALRAQDLRFGDMDIFHRIDATTGETVFSVVRAVEPGSFDLTNLEDCAAPGVIAFLRLSSQGDAQEALEDMVHTAEAVADDLGGELLDENRNPFTAPAVEGYRSRALGFADRRVLHGAR
ncbi:MAG: hypothetical protein OXH37_08110 [Gammaproteobacteria bacterium]|nr:hypothetical protein [Gammaproteobacteria bacterium]